MVMPFVEGREAIIEAGGEDLKLCFQCGACSATCPWNMVRSFPVRRLFYEARLGIVELGNEATWLCTTCGACVTRCPRGVNLINIMKAMRRISASTRMMPQSLRVGIANVSGVGNPLGQAREERPNWAEGLNVKTYTSKTEWLLFPCCYNCYEPRIKQTALSLVNILNKANIDFGILPGSENCCGEGIGTTGDEKLFQSLVRGNLQLFAEAGVKNILTISPHCYHAFKN
ncbi:MAG: (Fe-S)-binding protein, partial [Dehalococcoidia bacterium]